MFVNANILNVRNSPNLGSSIVMQIPYGTPIFIRHSPLTSKSQGTNDWFFVPSLDGFVSTKYLQTNMPPLNRKHMVLHRLTASGACETDAIWQLVEKLDLHDGLVTLTRQESFALSKEIHTTFNGKYIVKAGSLNFEFANGIQSTKCNRLTKHLFSWARFWRRIGGHGTTYCTRLVETYPGIRVQRPIRRKICENPGPAPFHTEVLHPAIPRNFTRRASKIGIC